MKLNFQTRSNGVNYNAKVWDFGGQEIQRSIHNFFMTDNALYILLWTVRSGGGDKYENLKYWINSVISFSPNSKVIIVLNKAFDEAGRPNRLEMDYLNQEAIMKFFGKNVIDFAVISALYDRGIEQQNGLREKIRLHLQDLDKVGEELPISWFWIKQELERLSKSQPYLDYDDFQKSCLSDLQYGIKSKEEFEGIIDWLSNIGAILYYPGKRPLDQYIFLNPEWIIKPVYDLLLDKEKYIRNNGGRFNREDFLQMTGIKNRREADIILSLMEYFHLCIRIHHEQEEYVVPQLMKDIEEQEMQNIDLKTYPLYCEYNYVFQPKGMLNQFIAQCYRDRLVRNNKLWNNAVLLTRDTSEAFVHSEVLRRDRICIRVKGENASALLDNIRTKLDALGERAQLESELIGCTCNFCQTHKNGPAMYNRKVIDDMRKKKIEGVQCTKSYDMIPLESLLALPMKSAKKGRTTRTETRQKDQPIQIKNAKNVIIRSDLQAKGNVIVGDNQKT